MWNQNRLRLLWWWAFGKPRKPTINDNDQKFLQSYIDGEIALSSLPEHLQRKFDSPLDHDA